MFNCFDAWIQLKSNPHKSLQDFEGRQENGERSRGFRGNSKLGREFWQISPHYEQNEFDSRVILTKIQKGEQKYDEEFVFEL